MKKKGLSLPPAPQRWSLCQYVPQGTVGVRNGVLVYVLLPTRATDGRVACIWLLFPVKCHLEIFTYQLLQIHELGGGIPILQRRKLFAPFIEARTHPACCLRCPSYSGLSWDLGPAESVVTCECRGVRLSPSSLLV